jgi:hypothetical protein
MKLYKVAGVFAILVLFLSSFSPAQAEESQQSQAGQAMSTVKFPPNDNCTTYQPCRTIMGEIVRVEEAYVIRQPNGSESHVNIQPDTNIRALNKVGDNVAVQLSSRGVAHAVVKLDGMPQPGMAVPQKTLEDLR